ncbi:13501_t:CDS:2, partial [Dentiscutata heterogama]
MDKILSSKYKIRLTRYDDLRVYLELYEKLIDVKERPIKTSSIIIFLKYFNPHTQLLEGLGQLYVQKDYTVNVLFPILCEKKQFPLNMLLDIYKEFEPNIVKKMSPNFTFRKYKIQNGDIICFQKTLTNK